MAEDYHSPTGAPEANPLWTPNNTEINDPEDRPDRLRACCSCGHVAEIISADRDVCQAAHELDWRLTSTQVVKKETRQSSRIANLPASNVSLAQKVASPVTSLFKLAVYMQLVDLDSDSDQEVLNPKRTPVAAKRKRDLVQEDSPEAPEHDNDQVRCMGS